MQHNVNSVQTLHDDAYALYNNVIVGGAEFSADTIIANLNAGIEILKNTWKGKDAGVQIQNVITVQKAMVGIRGILATLAATTSKIAANYREIQNSNGAGLESFGVINPDTGAPAATDYTDTADTINITQEANNGKAKIDAANSAIGVFIVRATKFYEAIMQNWTAGTGREELSASFDSFISKSNSYKETLNSVSESIRTALANYGL